MDTYIRLGDIPQHLLLSLLFIAVMVIFMGRFDYLLMGWEWSWSRLD
jgi:hypothetical protein